MSVGISKKPPSSSSSQMATKKKIGQIPLQQQQTTLRPHFFQQQQHHHQHHVAEAAESAVFQVDSPKTKPFGNRMRPWTDYVFAVVCVAWLIVLTGLHVLGGGGGGGGGQAASPVAGPLVPVLDSEKNYIRFTHPFTLQPDANTNDKIQVLTNLQLTLENVIVYDVCCMHQVYFVCRTSNVKNVGVDAYLTSNKSAMVLIIHPDMVGARCVLRWTEKVSN